MLDNGNLPPCTPEAKKTKYFYEGKEIVGIRKQGKPKIYRNPLFFDQATKVDAATLYCVYGDVTEVSRLTDVPEKTLKEWKQEPWWFEVQKQVYVEQNEKLASQLSTTLTKTIEDLNERLTNGDYTYNPKTGEVTRKPIEARVVISIFDSLAHQRRITRGEPTNISAKVGVDDRLKRLEEAFINFASVKTIEGEVING
jgi:hypothetical protein